MRDRGRDGGRNGGTERGSGGTERGMDLTGGRDRGRDGGLLKACTSGRGQRRGTGRAKERSSSLVSPRRRALLPSSYAYM